MPTHHPDPQAKQETDRAGDALHNVRNGYGQGTRDPAKPTVVPSEPSVAAPTPTAPGGPDEDGEWPSPP